MYLLKVSTVKNKSFIVPLFLLSVVANASSVVFTLESVHFEDGGTAYGSFTYDTDSGLFADVSITTSAGTILDGAFFDAAACTNAGCSPDDGIQAWKSGFSTIQRSLFLLFDGPMTNADGTLHLVPSSSGEIELNGIETLRLVVSGSITAVPIPAAMWLFSMSLMLLGCMKRRYSN
jgi:hypothetical protein